MLVQRSILVFLYFFIAFYSQAEAVGGTPSVTNVAKTVRRTQSMRPLMSHKAKSNINVRTRSDSFSSTSSVASDSALTEHNKAEAQPIATSSKKHSADFSEVDLQSTVEKSKHVSFGKSINLNEASVATDGNINPARDGAFARLQSVLRYGTGAAIGTAIGLGGAVINQRLNQNITETAKVATNTTLSEMLDDIINPLGN